MKKVSIIVPSFNEANFILALINQIKDIDLRHLNFEKEVIVIDDGSTDKTREILEAQDDIKYFYQINLGKGSAVQNGIRRASGDYILVQDADLEYSPQDYIPMLKIIKDLDFPTNVAVYGSRTLVERNLKKFIRLKPLKNQSHSSWLMNLLLTVLVIIFYRRFITDTLTGYKIYPKSFFLNNKIETKGFETDHEITAKLIRKHYKIIETPIRYSPRTKEEGKKINMMDGFKAIYTIIRYRLTNV
jgi:glycosyltransferase involved in cell wall biosynthesis